MTVPFRTHHLHLFFDGWDIDTTPLDLALYHYFRERRSLGSKDRKAITEAVFEMIKWRRLIDFPETQLTMRERLDRYLEDKWRERAEDSSIPGAIRTSLPEFIWERFVAGYGEEEAIRIGKVLNTKAPLTLRVNTLKTSREALFDQLKEQFALTLTDRSSFGIKLLEGAKVRDLPAYVEGHFEIQDEGSQLLSEAVAAKPGDQFLDYCAGSGGKSLAVAMGMKGKGQLFLHDIRKKSLHEAKVRLARAGIQNYQLLLSDSNHKKKLKGTMDWVLVDAPCSGTGTFRRSPELKWKLTPDSIEFFVKTQRQVFEEALLFLKPGGHIVYATCSLLPEENELQMAHFLSKYPLTFISKVKILPEKDGPDGFFAAVFQKPKNILPG